MALSRVVLKGNGVTNTFNVSFALGILSEDDVACQVAGEVDGSGDPIYRTITFVTPTQITISGSPPGNNVDVIFTRSVPRTSLLVNFNDEDIINEDNLQLSQKQMIMLAHEVLDGRFERFDSDIDMGGFSIRDLRTPNTEDQNDAATVEYVDLRVDQKFEDYAGILTQPDVQLALNQLSAIRIPAFTDVNLYVSATGSDSNPGTFLLPLRNGTTAYNILRNRSDGRGLVATIWVIGTGNSPIVCRGDTTFSKVYIQGFATDLADRTTWANVGFDPAASSQNIVIEEYGSAHVRGLGISHTLGNGLVAWKNSIAEYSSLMFGAVHPTAGAHVWSTQGSQIEKFGNNGVIGNAGSHVQISHGGRYRVTNLASAGIVAKTRAYGPVTFAVGGMYILNGAAVLTSERPAGGAFDPNGNTVTGRQFYIDGDASEGQFYGVQVPTVDDIFGSALGSYGVRDQHTPRALGGVLYPAPISTNMDNWNPGVAGKYLVNCNRLKIIATVPVSINGLWSAGMVDGQEITIQNAGAPTLTFVHEAASSVESARFYTPNGANLTLPVHGCMTIMWDAVFNRWIVQTKYA